VKPSEEDAARTPQPMMDQQVLFEKFISLLQTEPALPDYLEAEAEPGSDPPFDPYQLVAEWTALRHEVKQQGKLVQATQTSLQQALDALQTEKADLQQQLEISRKQGIAQTDQKSLWRDLLTVVDALDQASNHWQAQLEALESPAAQPLWQLWLQKLSQSNLSQSNLSQSNLSGPNASLRDILVSNQQGVDLIRRSLLDVLQQRQVVPIVAQGQPFDPQTMYAIGRQESLSPENTVLQEVVRGYKWHDQILREAQVIVAAKKDET
jgi:molecular chaperone GrpE